MSNLYLPVIARELVPLKDAFGRHGILFGMATSNSEMKDDLAKAIFDYHANLIVPGDQMKMAVVQPYEEIFVYEHNHKMREMAPHAHGHCLYWGQRYPEWLIPRLQKLDIDGRYDVLALHIAACMKAYSTWNSMDVINEGFTQPSPWMEYIGPASIPWALTIAKGANPALPRYYNGVFLGLPEEMKSVMALIDQKAIDGVGIQWHRKAGVDDTPWIPELIDFAAAVKRKGLPVRMSEVTIRPNGNEGDFIAKWREAVRLALMIGVTAFVQWGINDGPDSWQGDSLLFDREYQAKKSYHAVIEEL